MAVAAAEGQRGDAAAPGRVPPDLASLIRELAAKPYARADHLRVEAPGKPAVARYQQQPHVALGVVLGEQWQPRGLRARSVGRLAGHAADRLGVGAQRGNALFCAAQASGGDHLHRARDLLDVLDRGDPVSDVALRCHVAGRPWR